MLSSSAAYEICRLCNWEDDGQDSHNADEVWGGPNHSYSLVEARDNFERYLVMYPPDDDPRFGGHDTERQREIKRTMIATFDKMIKCASLDELQSLWQIVFEKEKELELEVKRRINIKNPLFDLKPCPYCGEPLRTVAAKQCRQCGTDWHDPNNVIKLDKR